MSSLLPYFVLTTVMIIITSIFIIIYRIRMNFLRQQVLPCPMHVFVVAQPHQLQSNYPQAFWASTIDHLPPPYSSVVPQTRTRCNPVSSNNEP
ncbi:unnamed protein product [Adineta ricciae]|uniref:Uncharacterized protein n=1 Tax=Adineta ricciae TaxID=249248 RepID=A0A814RL48_ADIRI|nr:unnamed protein product [Adineta ricciae]